MEPPNPKQSRVQLGEEKRDLDDIQAFHGGCGDSMAMGKRHTDLAFRGCMPGRGGLDPAGSRGEKAAHPNRRGERLAPAEWRSGGGQAAAGEAPGEPRRERGGLPRSGRLPATRGRFPWLRRREEAVKGAAAGGERRGRRRRSCGRRMRRSCGRFFLMRGRLWFNAWLVALNT